VGSAWLLVPKVGFALMFLYSPLPLASLATGIVVAYFVVPGKRQRR
jgi:hypothetical protein